MEAWDCVSGSFLIQPLSKLRLKMANSNQYKRIYLWTLLPLFGIILFLLLYFIATLYYPGGAQFDKTTKGFSWTQNYWCNLLNENAINGLPNPARPIAITA